MAENKQYITQIQENGNVMISEDVVAAIVAHALAEVDGIGSMGSKPGIVIADFAAKKNWSKSLKILIAEDNTVSIDCSIMIAYGHSVVEVAEQVQAAVVSAVQSTASVKKVIVNVNVCGIMRQ